MRRTQDSWLGRNVAMTSSCCTCSRCRVSLGQVCKCCTVVHTVGKSTGTWPGGLLPARTLPAAQKIQYMELSHSAKAENVSRQRICNDLLTTLGSSCQPVSSQHSSSAADRASASDAALTDSLRELLLRLLPSAAGMVHAWLDGV